MKIIAAILCVISFHFSASQSNIVGGEFFFDSDPGVGSAQPIPGVVTSSSIDIDFLSNVSTLSLGTHTLGIRLQDENNVWTFTSYIQLLVLASNPLVLNTIAQLEYFYDTDPGYGLGIQIPITSATNITISDLLPTNGLTLGMHSLSVRVKSDQNEWSMIESVAVFVSPNNLTIVSEIDEVEYFFDTDPGIGNGTSISFSNSSILDMKELVSIAGLDIGVHNISIRIKSVNGEWSLIKSSPFYVKQSESLIQFEHFIDLDPGIGNANTVAITPPANTLELEFSVPTSSLATGNHFFNIRLGTTNDVWGITEIAPFTLCDGAIAIFQPDQVCEGNPTTFTDLSTNVLSGDIYSWDFESDGSEDDSSIGTVSHMFPSPGSYPTTLTIDRAGCPGISKLTTIVDTLITLSASGPQTTQFGSEINLNGNTSGLVQDVLWTTDGSGIFNDPSSLNPMYTPSIRDGLAGSINISFTATATGNCQIEDVILPLAVSLPADLMITVYNAISPNDDGKHDYFEIENIEAYSSNKVVVFNRWGDIVFDENGYDNLNIKFTGKNNQKLLPAGTYYYEIDLGNSSDLIKGFIMLNH